MKDNIVNKNTGTNNIITCDKLKVGYGSKKNPKFIIDDFDYAFNKNKIYALVGSSGVGKTSLISHFNALSKSRWGNVFVGPWSVLGSQKKVKNHQQIRKLVGLVMQFPEHQLFKSTVEKDIAFGPINFGVSKAKALALAAKYLNIVGLDEKYLKASPFDLSNGQKRLVAIAGVLASDPEVIIFDEPTAGLDPSAVKKIIKIIKYLHAHNKTIIIISHNMDNVLELADEVLVLHDKKLLVSGKPYDVLNNTNVIRTAKLQKPQVIDTINKLVAKNPKYSYLLSKQPRTLDELVKLLKGGK